MLRLCNIQYSVLPMLVSVFRIIMNDAILYRVVLNKSDIDLKNN